MLIPKKESICPITNASIHLKIANDLALESSKPFVNCNDHTNLFAYKKNISTVNGVPDYPLWMQDAECRMIKYLFLDCCFAFNIISCGHMDVELNAVGLP